MGIEGIGARVARKEDKRFITGAGRYVDDMVVPGMKHAVFVRSPHAHAEITSIDVAAAKAMPGVIGVLDRQGAEGRRHRQHHLRLDDPFQGRLADEDGRVVAAGGRQGALCRRRGRGGGGRHQGPGARCRRGGRDRLQGTARGYRRVEGDGRRPAANPSGGGKQPDLRLGDRQSGRDRGGVPEGRACRQARHHQQPAGAERDGAARGTRRLRQGGGPLHLLDDVAEPASRQAGDERLLQHRAGEQAARDRA